jgi:hypothetical protein
VRRSVLVLIPLVLLAAGCASTGTISTTPVTAGTGAAAASTAPAKAAGLGDTVAIEGFNGEHIALTLVKVVTDAKGADEFTSPSAGKHFFAVQVRIVNTSKSVVYSDSPDNGMVAKDGAGQQFQTDVASITAGPGFGSVKLAPGDTALGYEVFQVPTGDKVTKVQYTIDSGMGSGTAQWSLG